MFKRMMVLPILVLAVAAGLVGTSEAQAHSTTWHWTAQVAANTVVEDGLDWREGYDDVTYAYCKGKGSEIYRGGKVLFKHFSCYVETAAGEEYVIALHVTGKYGYTYSFTRWA